MTLWDFYYIWPNLFMSVSRSIVHICIAPDRTDQGVQQLPVWSFIGWSSSSWKIILCIWSSSSYLIVINNHSIWTQCIWLSEGKGKEFSIILTLVWSYWAILAKFPNLPFFLESLPWIVVPRNEKTSPSWSVTSCHLSPSRSVPWWKNVAQCSNLAIYHIVIWQLSHIAITYL